MATICNGSKAPIMGGSTMASVVVPGGTGRARPGAIAHSHQTGLRVAEEREPARNARDMRDNRACSSLDQSCATGDGAFNIKAESMRRCDFTDSTLGR